MQRKPFKKTNEKFGYHCKTKFPASTSDMAINSFQNGLDKATDAMLKDADFLHASTGTSDAEYVLDNLQNIPFFLCFQREYSLKWICNMYLSVNHFVSAEAEKVAGLSFLYADAGASAGSYAAGASASPLAIKAAAHAECAHAGARAAIIKDVVEVAATADLTRAGASIGYSACNLQLVKAQASVVAGKAGVGITNTPLQAHVSVGEAGGEAGVGWQYTGANIGASLAEAKAGPFAARVGMKFGAGVRNGIPELDAGPVTTPCSIM